MTGIIFSHYHSRRRARRALLFSLCLRCGYDLLATEELCPECGEPVSIELQRLRRAENAECFPPPIELAVPDRLLPDPTNEQSNHVGMR